MIIACASQLENDNLLERQLGSPSSPVRARNEIENLRLSSPAAPPFTGYTKLGTDKLTGNPALPQTNKYDSDAEDVMLNLNGVAIPVAAKSVLGDILELDYSIDPQVNGSVTLQTPKPISRKQLIQLFEGILRDNGAAIIASGNSYRVVPLTVAAKTTSALQVKSEETPGVRQELVTLKYVSANNIREVLEPMIPPGMLVRTDDQRNALILSGSAGEIANIRETISVFDVDWMQGMSFSLVPVTSSSPAAIVQELEQVFQSRTGPLKGIVRFAANERLHSVLIMSSQSKYIRDATAWIKKLDVMAESGEESLHIYHVQNRNANELAKVLEAVLGVEKTKTVNAEANVAPKLEPAEAGGGGNQMAAGGMLTGGPETPAAGPDVMSNDMAVGGEAIKEKRMRVVADDSNNSLLIYCSDSQFQKIRTVLQQIDSVPNQVLLEAVIAEVSLNDDLRFGVRWYIGKKDDHGTFSDAASGAVSSVFPGFSYFLKANDISVALNALSSVTNVRVLSAPTLVVVDNKTATLQVGDEVPIVTQSAKSTDTASAPIVANVELKNTGLILKVTPRVNDSGLVTLDVEQEVSDAVKTTTSGIDSPTIRQRKMKTSVVVNDAEALALGGLIQEKDNTGKTKVPVLGDVPVLGTAFRHKTNITSRTELIVFIRPRVIRDLNEARRITEDFRREINIQAPHVPTGKPTPISELMRILE